MQTQNIISTQNPTPYMSEIRHFSVAFSTHTPFFGVGGVMLDLRHSTNVGQRSDRPFCCIFNCISFQSANQNRINYHKSDRNPTSSNPWSVGLPKDRSVEGMAVSSISKIRRHSTLEESAFRRSPTLEPSVVRRAEVSESWNDRRMGLLECRKNIKKATPIDGFKKKIQIFHLPPHGFSLKFDHWRKLVWTRHWWVNKQLRWLSRG